MGCPWPRCSHANSSSQAGCSRSVAMTARAVPTAMYCVSCASCVAATRGVVAPHSARTSRTTGGARSSCVWMPRRARRPRNDSSPLRWRDAAQWWSASTEMSTACWAARTDPSVGRRTAGAWARGKVAADVLAPLNDPGPAGLRPRHDAVPAAGGHGRGVPALGALVEQQQFVPGAGESPAEAPAHLPPRLLLPKAGRAVAGTSCRSVARQADTAGAAIPGRCAPGSRRTAPGSSPSAARRRSRCGAGARRVRRR